MERNEAIESLRQLYFDTNAENKAALECLIPELKESEDERIMDTIIEHFKGFSPIKVFGDFDFTSKQIITYLEKQKEQKPELCDMGRWDEESYNNGIHHVLQNPEKYGLTKQKPAEWSEDDELLLNAAIYMVEKGNITFAFENNKCKVSDWLKLLPERFGLQPKQEWSEEDESILRLIHEALSCAYSVKNMDAQTCSVMREWLNNRVKSLRPEPQQEWSDGNKQWFDAIIKDYEDSLSGDEDHDPAIQIKINLLKSIRLKSIRPQPHWKPSEEQMEVFSQIVQQFKPDKELESLYNDLKKLI